METSKTQHLKEDVSFKLEAKQKKHYPPLESVTSYALPTDATAFYLNRKSQTLRAWACLENGPIRPVRINGRLAWPVAQIISLLDGGKQ